jgi:hypothetical protein
MLVNPRVIANESDADINQPGKEIAIDDEPNAGSCDTGGCQEMAT